MTRLRLVIVALAALAVPCTSVADPIIDLHKSVNGVESVAPPGPTGELLDVVTFTYGVENHLTESLAAVLLADDNGTPDPRDDFTPTFLGGDVTGNALLDLSEIWVYAAVVVADIEGQFQNTATASAIGQPSGVPTLDTATAHYFVGTPQVVPEPSALLLLGLGLAGLAFSRRKRAA